MPKVSKVNARARLVAAANQLLSANTMEHTTVNQITDAADAGQGTIYLSYSFEAGLSNFVLEVSA